MVLQVRADGKPVVDADAGPQQNRRRVDRTPAHDHLARFDLLAGRETNPSCLLACEQDMIDEGVAAHGEVGTGACGFDVRVIRRYSPTAACRQRCPADACCVDGVVAVLGPVPERGHRGAKGAFEWGQLCDGRARQRGWVHPCRACRRRRTRRSWAHHYRCACNQIHKLSLCAFRSAPTWAKRAEHNAHTPMTHKGRPSPPAHPAERRVSGCRCRSRRRRPPAGRTGPSPPCPDTLGTWPQWQLATCRRRAATRWRSGRPCRWGRCRPCARPR